MREDPQHRASEARPSSMPPSMERFFRAICSLPGFAVAIMDRDLRLEFANETLASFSGLTAEACHRRTVDELWPAAATDLRPAVAKALETGDTITIELIFGWDTMTCDVVPMRDVTGPERALVVVRPGARIELQPPGHMAVQLPFVQIFNRLARMNAANAESVIHEALADVCKHLRVDRAVTRVLREDGHLLALSHRYDGPDLPTIVLTDDPASEYPVPLASFARGEALVINSRSELTAAQGQLRRQLERLRCESACMVSLHDGTSLLGGLVFACAQPRHWTTGTVSRLRSFADMVATAMRRVAAEQELLDRLRFEQTVTRVSTELLDASVGDLDEALTEGLRWVAVGLHFDRATLAQLDATKQHFLVTHEWCAPGVPSFRGKSTKLSVATLGWSVNNVREGTFHRTSYEDIPAHASAAKNLVASAGIRALVQVPLVVETEVIGNLVFHLVRHREPPAQSLLERLRVVADIFASALLRARAAESLEESEVRFAQVIESVPDGVALLDANGVVLEWNAQASRLFARQRHEAVGRRFQEIAVDPEDEGRLRLETPGSGRVELTGTRAERRFPMEVTLAPMRRAGAPLFALFVRDISDRKRTEQARERALQEVTKQKESLERERDYLREEVGGEGSSGAGAIQATSLAARTALESLEAVAGTSATVLLHGESGVGKEVFARALHARSPRSSGPLVRVNCASIPESLFESEFFGHVRGAFTGAHKDRIGRFELADGGSLFLDEVGEIPMAMQAKLLRVLQEGEFERVGEDKTRKANARIIAATNRDLAAEVQEGRFRRDLYYRLSVFPIEIPPLRDRSEDILPMAEQFLQAAARAVGRTGLSLSPSQQNLLLEYDWPGNVRELQHTIERAVILSSGSTLQLERALAGGPSAAAPTSASGSGRGRAALPSEGRVMTSEELKQLERDNILTALERAGGRVAGEGGAAALLGLSPSTLRDRMKTLGIRR